MKINTYISEIGKSYCNKVIFGIDTGDLEDKLQNALIRKRINETGCDVKVVEPELFCNINKTVSYQNSLPDGDGEQNIPVPIMYGYYLFNTDKNTNLDADVVALDISDYPQNYFLSVLPTSFTLIGNHIFYPVIRTPIGIDLQILDVVNAIITPTFTLFTDNNYNYYVQMQVVPANFALLFNVSQI
jgi:hypothetical protein